MRNPWQIRIYDGQELRYAADMAVALELGRQIDGEEGPFALHLGADRGRLVMAGRDEKDISRRHLLVAPQVDGGVRISNLSEKLPIRLPDGTELLPQSFRELPFPVDLTVGKRTVRVQVSEPVENSLYGLEEATAPPGLATIAFRFPRNAVRAGGKVKSKAVIRWLHAALDVLQSAADSADFFLKAARGVVDLVGLDSGRVLLREGDAWVAHALHVRAGIAAEGAREPSRHVLSKVCAEKRTFREIPVAGSPAASLEGVNAVVAAPILHRNGQVIGALYGDRGWSSAGAGDLGITELEAHLVELLASGVAAGLARLEQERATLQAENRFEQFFTPELARQLVARPDLLQGRDTEVSILFADIREFSRISEHLGPARTMDWIQDVMGTLSECVRAHDGVLVDYIGDELMAMWGAPESQPDHVCRAARAALAMHDRLPELNERWQIVLQRPIEIGIGINTGLARVGNTGSRQKFKYGPLGNTVNLASRVQGATKYLQTPLLITGSTRAQLDAGFDVRRLCSVRVVNIAAPVELYQLTGPGKNRFLELKQGYESALGHFEQGEFRLAARGLGNLFEHHANDGPSLVLLSRAVDALIQKPTPFDPVWELPGK